MDLQERVKRMMDHLGWSQSRVAEETGLSRSVVSTWLAGNYAHAGMVDGAMEALIARQTGGMQIDFLTTKAAKRVWEACMYALQRRRITTVIGRPGLGKTEALKEFHRQRTLEGIETIYHFCSPAIREHSLAKMLCRRFELRTSGTTYDLLEAVVGKLRRGPVPLIFDEANHFSVKCLEVVRYIYDSVGVPIVLCGSIKLQRTLSESNDRYPELEQLQSRIALRVLLQPMGLGETKMLLVKHFGGEVPMEVVKEFHSRGHGVIRDIVNAATNVKQVMALNKLEGPTVEAVQTAFEHQLMAA